MTECRYLFHLKKTQSLWTQTSWRLIKAVVMRISPSSQKKTKLSIKPWKWRYIIKLNIELHSFSFFLFFYFNFLNFFYDFAVMEFLTRNTSGVWSAQHKTSLRQWSISGRISEKPNYKKMILLCCLKSDNQSILSDITGSTVFV